MGALTIRFPESLHQRLKVLAAKEGVSLNQFVVQAASERATLYEAETKQIASLKRRAQQYEAELKEQDEIPLHRMQALMNKGPDVKPREDDRLP
jgi:uncharacterized protein (DUF1778 family)